MTAIYVPASPEGFELCQPEKEEDFETLNVEVNGTPKDGTWHPISMRLIIRDEKEDLVKSDSPWLGSHALIFRRSAVEKLGRLLREYGELLPLSCPDAELFLFNPTRIVAALDEHASDVTRFAGGRIMRVTRYVFRADAITGVDIFKIPSLRVSPTFLSERVIQLWTSAGLHGLDFRRVWSP